MARTALRAVVAAGVGVALALPTSAAVATPTPTGAAPRAAQAGAVTTVRPAASTALPAASTARPAAQAAGPVVPRLPKVPVMRGTGGAVATVDDVASQVGTDVLSRGGNAVDAA